MQPPSGGCVLKRYSYTPQNTKVWQPPSGGCVLKLENLKNLIDKLQAAAFGRLCVETLFDRLTYCYKEAAAFGRLCVETELTQNNTQALPLQPPSGGCVLKRLIST